MKSVALGAIAVLAWSRLAIAGDNPDLERARELIEAVQLDEAVRALDAAVARGGNDPEQMATIYRLLGEAAAGVGDDARATDAFARLLAIEPTATLDEFSSPKLQTAFDAAAQAAPPGGYLVLEHQLSGSGAVSVTLERRADTLGMVAAAELVYTIPGGKTYRLRGDGEGAIEITLPARQVTDVVLYAVDGRGNRLRGIALGTLGSDRPEVVAPPSLPPAPPQPIYRKLWAWGAVTGVFAVAGVGFTVARFSARSDLDAILADDRDHFFSEARDAENRVNRYTALTVVSYSLAAASAVAGAVLVLTAPDAPAEPAPPVKAGVVPLPGGAAVSMELSF